MIQKLGSLGEISFKTPAGAAICYDFLTIWAGDLNRAQLLRLCASAIAVCAPGHFPPYPLTDDPITWGSQAVDKLHASGVEPAEIYSIGVQCLRTITSQVITEKEVQKAENFLSPGGALTG